MLRNFWRKTLGKEDVQKPEQSGWEFNYAMDFVRQTFTVKTWQCIIIVRISSTRKKELVKMATKLSHPEMFMLIC